MTNIMKQNIYNISVACDHSAGHEFYTESILHKTRYLAYRCPNYQTYKVSLLELHVEKIP